MEKMRKIWLKLFAIDLYLLYNINLLKSRKMFNPTNPQKRLTQNILSGKNLTVARAAFAVSWIRAWEYMYTLDSELASSHINLSTKP